MLTFTGTGTTTLRPGGQCMKVMFSTRLLTELMCTTRGCRHTGQHHWQLIVMWLEGLLRFQAGCANVLAMLEGKQRAVLSAADCDVRPGPAQSPGKLFKYAERVRGRSAQDIPAQENAHPLVEGGISVQADPACHDV